ncbi:MAG: hypothetical protein ACXABO_05435 [Promethearchaeota archaeon]|jgi:predicted regulator of Ras-like GTPase activity (Roadblock/LC7/MglB family)
MSAIDKEIQQKMMYLLKDEEENTDLENLSVLSRVGMKVASATSSENDADATSASSTALIDLGLRLNQATDHGALTEIILHSSSGYSILVAINDEYIVFGGLSAVFRIGYYLGYLRVLAKKLNKLISGDEATEMMLSLESSELKKMEEQKKEEESKKITKPSVEQDKAALDDLLGFLDDWEKEGEDFEELEATDGANIVSIPSSIGIGIEKEVKHVTEIETHEVVESPISEPKSDLIVYEDEVPPVPLDDYAPMEIEEKPITEDLQPIEEPSTEEISQVKPAPFPEKLPSLEELAPPDFDFEAGASEYDTEFVLEEESEALGSVLKDLGWDQEDD